MCFVNGETFYHINRNVQWGNGTFEKGGTYQIGSTLNPFMNFYEVASFHVDETVESHKRLLNEYLKMNREIIFEEVRRELYPDLPSRYKCLWLLPNELSAIDFWWNTIHQPSCILKLKVTGSIHKANQVHLTPGLFNKKQLREKAIKYWSGSTPEDNLFEEEILFEGSIQVEEVYSIDQIRELFKQSQ